MELKQASFAAALLCAALGTAWAQAQPQNPSPTDPAMAGAQGGSQADTPMMHSNRPMTESDARATKEVNDRLSADPKHYFRHVQVSVHDGVAELTGFVYSSDAVYKAKELAQQAPGVTRVDSRVRVERNGNTGSQPD
ncbi:MAG TPA: BON domain-containing protein [Steroidobacteraceae bacterium]|nr:BON domain-containing protein [Steroidobacteraceae bacterium]